MNLAKILNDLISSPRAKLPLLSLCFTVCCSFDNGISVLGSCSVAPAGRDQIFLLRCELAQMKKTIEEYDKNNQS